MYESAEASKNGKVFIFNNVDFSDNDDLKTREGSDKDEKDLRDVFGSHGYDVAEEKKNLTITEFYEELRKIANEDFSDYKCMIAIFLSHGDKDHIYMKDGPAQLGLIPQRFRGDKCSSLNYKPKIFIFQACRGGKAENPAHEKTTKNQPVSGDIERDGDGFQESSENEANKPSENEANTPSENEASVEEDAGASCSAPAGADFVMGFASSQGYVSFRDTKKGSWYIQMLVQTLNEYFEGRHKDDTFLDLMTKVSGLVSQRRSSEKVIFKMQMPSIVSMLRDKFYLPKIDKAKK